MVDMDYNEAFRNALKLQVDTLGKGNQSAIARKVGVNQQYISLILKGDRNASEKTRRKIADRLGYKYEEFLAMGREISAEIVLPSLCVKSDIESELEQSLEVKESEALYSVDDDKRGELHKLVDQLEPGDVELFVSYIKNYITLQRNRRRLDNALLDRFMHVIKQEIPDIEDISFNAKCMAISIRKRMADNNKKYS